MYLCVCVFIYTIYFLVPLLNFFHFLFNIFNFLCEWDLQLLQKYRRVFDPIKNDADSVLLSHISIKLYLKFNFLYSSGADQNLNL